MHLDIPTITVLACVVFVSQAIALFVQYRVNKTYVGFGWWLLGAILQAIGFLLLPLVTMPSVWMLSVFANPLIIAGQLSMGVGILRFLGIERWRRSYVVSFAAFLAFYALSVFTRDGILWRSVVVSASTALVSLHIGATLWLRKEKPYAGSAIFTALIFLAYGCFQAFMAILVLYLPPIGSYYEIERYPIRVLSFIVPIASGTLWTFGFIIMVNQRLNAEIFGEKEKLQLVFNISPEAMVISRMSDGLVVDINAGFLAITGYSRAETIGRTIIDLGAWEKEEDRASYLSELQREGSIDGREYPFRKKGGSLFLGLVSSRLIEIRGQSYAIMAVYDITERRLAEDKINKLLAEKELILKEVHHRVKNNMSTICSLLSLQAGTLRDPAAVTALEDTGSRVKSMMVLYDKLYHSTSFSALSIAEYFPSLVDEILAGFPNAASVRVETRIEDIDLEASMLQPLGLIVNELLTNIMKYAFAGRGGGVISVSASLEDELLSIAIADDGNGMPDSVDFDNSTGFGLLLVKTLVEQMKGRIGIERGNGTKIVLAIPMTRASR
jgi:PAS domain S-box-containing protein